MASVSLQTWLSSLAGRLQRRRSLYAALVGLWPVLLLSLLLLVAGRLWPLPHWRWWALLPPLLWALVQGLRFPFLRPSPERAARLLDHELGLRERLATAWELERHGQQDALPRAQREDALRHVRQIRPARDLPWWIPRRALAAAGLLLLGCLTLFCLPNPQDIVLQQRAALRQAAEEQAAELEALAEEIAAMEGLSPEEKEALLQALDEAAERLRQNPGQAEEALADIEAAREALEQALEKRRARQAAVDETEAFLRDLADQLAQGDEAARQAMLENLEKLPEYLQGLSDQEMAELALRAAELARRAASDPELAQALEQFAQALESADPGALAQASEALEQALENAEAQIAAQAQTEADLEAALEALGQGEEALAEAGAGEGEGAGEEAGEGEGGGWHPDPGQPAEGQDSSGEEVYVPLGPDGQPAYVPGEVEGGGSEDVAVLPSLDPEEGAEGAAVPYDAVYYDYREAAARSLERSYVPAGRREYVQAYFAGLEP
ncbi:MAG: hypothetical protein JXA37_04665 [Chloroflexia bacterium]|nr:hypothetical protein [Chloroflexia bacterium]